jgi:hypothetical protein
MPVAVSFILSSLLSEAIFACNEIYYCIDAHDVAKVVLNMSNPVFQESSASSKIITVIKELRKLKVGSENIGMAPIAHGLLTRLRVRLDSLGLMQKILDCHGSTGLVQEAHSGNLIWFSRLRIGFQL